MKCRKNIHTIVKQLKTKYKEKFGGKSRGILDGNSGYDAREWRAIFII